MLRRILKAVALLAVAIVVVGAALYQFFGLRAVLDGGGMPRLRFVERVLPRRGLSRARLQPAAGRATRRCPLSSLRRQISA